MDIGEENEGNGLMGLKEEAFDEYGKECDDFNCVVDDDEVDKGGEVDGILSNNARIG